MKNKTFIEKVENIEKVFIVSRRKNKKVKPETVDFDLTGSKIILTFPNRKSAEKYVRYWNNGENLYDILERKLK